MDKVKIALCQMEVGVSKRENLAKAEDLVEQAAKAGAEIVMLPEMFNCPYDINCFSSYAEELPQGETGKMLAGLARKMQIYLIGGSIPEVGQDGQLFNTSLVFDRSGNLVGKHRKVHLFDVQVKNGINFMESATLAGGDRITLVDSPWGKIGIMICYDIRFPELARRMAELGAKIICVPAAFNMTTGPVHWELLFRSRALDNQLFILGNSPARNEQASYTAYGHSLVVDPWGEVLNELDEKEGILESELNLTKIDEVRQAIPVWTQRRKDVYNSGQ